MRMLKCKAHVEIGFGTSGMTLRPGNDYDLDQVLTPSYTVPAIGEPDSEGHVPAREVPDFTLANAVHGREHDLFEGGADIAAPDASLDSLQASLDALK